MIPELYVRQPQLWRLYQSIQTYGDHCARRVAYLESLVPCSASGLGSLAGLSENKEIKHDN